MVAQKYKLQVEKNDISYSFFLLAFSTTHLNLNTVGELLALDITVTVLSCLSIVGDVLNDTFISPRLPGLIWYSGFSTVVQPHSTLVSLITRGPLPVLVNRYSNFKVSPLCTKPRCWVVLSNVITGWLREEMEPRNKHNMQTIMRIFLNKKPPTLQSGVILIHQDYYLPPLLTGVACTGAGVVGLLALGSSGNTLPMM